MVKKICLDTSACISILRNDDDAQLIRQIIEEGDVYISVITLFELLLRKTNLHVVENFVEHTYQLPMSSDVARHASALHKMLAQRGELIDLRDLFIAATCIANDCFLLTLNKKHFTRIPGIKLADA